MDDYEPEVDDYVIWHMKMGQQMKDGFTLRVTFLTMKRGLNLDGEQFQGILP